MLASFIIVFREVLEAALILGIILSYIQRAGRKELRFSILLSALAAVGASIIGAVLFSRLTDGFSGRTEELFEGIVMITGAVLVTTMVLWMMNESDKVKKLENKLESSLNSGKVTTLLAIVFISIFREGIEVVIFLSTLTAKGSGGLWTGSLLGFATAAILGLLIFVWGKKVSLSAFFKSTNILLILFAAGMLAYGIHELHEAGIIPPIVEHIYDINPAVNADGSYPALHEKGAVGSIFKGLFGYNGNPALFETLAYWAYLIGILAIQLGHKKRKTEKSPV
jgi:high-affinity iron transporter